MKVTEWREELKAAEAAIEAAREDVAAAKEEVRARQKRLDRAQKRRAEVLRAFISGESQMPLFDDQVEDDDEDGMGIDTHPGSPAWRETPVSAAVRSPVLAARISRELGLSTLGALAGAIQYGGGLAAVLGRNRMPPECVRSVAADLAAWAAEHPGFPVDALGPLPTDTAAPPDDWAATPLDMVVIRGDLLDWLAAMDLHTLGDLADACDLCGSLKLALDDWAPENAAEVERDVRAWTSRRPGFPLDLLSPPAAPPAGALAAALASAVDPGDADGWEAVARRGYDLRAIHGRLSSLWPDQPAYVEPLGDVPGYTVRGGDRPAFWLGHAAPSASAACRQCDLLGDALFEAVAEVLQASAAADAPAEAAPRKKKRAAAEARR